MANFTERIKIIVDVVTDGAKSGFAGLKSDVGEADGFFGKFKAGATSVFDSVKQNAGAMAVVGGAAIVGFGIKAVGAFTDTAKAAIDLSTSTGLSIDQASRWIAVGDDYEVSAQALATGLGKISKTLDDTKWGKYGIATHDAAGQARSANDIMLDAFSTLSAITNETERARVGQELFGKGYQSLTPILGHTRAEYEKMLGTVEKGQVITEQEAAKAEKFRLAEDQLGDALKDVTIQIGEQVAGLAPLLVGIAKLIALSNSAFGPGGLAGGKNNAALDQLHDMRDEVEKAGLDYGKLEEKVLGGALSIEQVKEKVQAATVALGLHNDTLDGGEKSWEDTDAHAKELADTFDGLTLSTYDVSAASADARKKIDLLKGAIDDATGQVGDYEQSNLKLNDSIADLVTKTAEANKTLQDSKATDEEKSAAIRGVREDQIDLARQMDENAGKYAIEQGAVEGTTRFYGLQRDKLLEMKAKYPELRDQIQQYIDILNHIPGVVSTKVVLTNKTGDVINAGLKGARMAGGPIGPGDWLVGEGGLPEIVHIDANGSGMVTNGANTRRALSSFHGGDTYNQTFVMPPGLNPQMVASASRNYRRRGGR